MYTKKESKNEIIKLVDSFERDLPKLKKGSLSTEATVEDNFIKPLFQFLNWNIHNLDLPYERSEFIVQFRNNKTGLRPDYLLRLPDAKSDRMKHILFIEAKHPKYDLMYDLRWIRQAYLYANSTLSLTEREEKRVPLSILTDFEEFRVFDCRDQHPLKENKIEEFNRRAIEPFNNWKFNNYVNEFEILWDIFERNQIIKGSLDSFKISDEDLKTSRIAPDLQFLNSLKQWRLELAQDMFRLDNTLDSEILTSATQLIINRLVFLKTLADKDLEEDFLSNILSKFSKNNNDDIPISFYNECSIIFDNLHKTFNGSIFNERRELDNVKVSNKLLKKIIESLRPEKSLYTLAAMPVRIIGTMYENFLEEKIVKSGRGIGSKSDESKKSDFAIFYTPEEIVEHILENTLEKKLETCKSPEDVIKLRIIDPSCGSGSFLIAAFDSLINWHINYYRNTIQQWIKKGDKLKTIKKRLENDYFITIRDETTNEYAGNLTIKKKAEILKNCIYGVDIDEQAIEISKFSLSLKVVEDFWDKDELYREVDLFKTTILPSLDLNIYLGNSLIDTNFKEELKLSLDEEFRVKKSIKPFSWKTNFEEIFNNGGFDIVIGNPPYLSYYSRHSKYTIEEEEKIQYFKNNYEFISYSGTRYNSVMFFLEKAMKLLRKDGLFSFIIDMNFNLDAFSGIRRYLATKYEIVEFTHNLKAFVGVNSGQVILTLKNSLPTKLSQFKIYQGLNSNYETQHQSTILADRDCRYLLPDSKQITNDSIVELKTIAKISTGVNIGGASELFLSDKSKGKNFYPLISTATLKNKYDLIKTNSVFINFSEDLVSKINLQNKKDGSRNVVVLGDLERFTNPKIFIRQSATEIIASLCMEHYVSPYSIFVANILQPKLDIKYILGILNSDYITKYSIKNSIIISGEGKQPQIRKKGLDSLPIKIPNLENSIERNLFEQIIHNVDKIIDAKHKSELLKTENEIKILNEILNTSFAIINKCVDKLYSL
ncbi:MAG TPA: TaqI-like C-terminal specificity domain-containing protein [Candidatus Absconditabacterales bacterium]|nr:TaqI-like C-terminal specificity domain-containing protein [Candidatus Absconditabacterales bacterium]